jgi:hypothetical protein
MQTSLNLLRPAWQAIALAPASPYLLHPCTRLHHARGCPRAPESWQSAGSWRSWRTLFSIVDLLTPIASQA